MVITGLHAEQFSELIGLSSMKTFSFTAARVIIFEFATSTNLFGHYFFESKVFNLFPLMLCNNAAPD